MNRSIVSLLLLPCLLLTQSAVFGHAHSGGQPTGHDLRTHVHTNPLAVDNHHGHDHNAASGSHHCQHDDLKDAPKPHTQHTPQPEPLSDHDSDAIYVNATDAVAVERSELPNGSVFWTALTCDSFARAWVKPAARPVVCGHPPPFPGHVCPLYVKHRTLLI